MSKSEASTLSSSGFYQVDEKRLRIKLVLTDNGKQASAQGNILFVIDKSGSMAGEWNQVLSAVQYMTNEVALEPSFILYDSSAKMADTATVLTSRAGGCTNFESAFKCIQSFIGTLPMNSHTNVVFMTDGQNNGGNLKSGLAILKAYLASCRRSTCIHTIGFSKSHDRNLLDQIRVLGTSEGVYRFAEDSKLDEKFEELFDFICVSTKATIKVASNAEQTIDCSKSENGREIDLILSLAEVDPKGELFNGKPCSVTVDSQSIELEAQSVDLFFTVRSIEEMEIVTQDDLMAVQGLLSGVNPSKAPKDQRRELMELRMVVQEKLDKFHTLFAEIARGLVSGDSVSAQLNSLRHETKFSKARRARAMDKRIASNIDEILAIEDELEKLPPPNLELFKDMELSCSLSNSSILEIMRDTPNDFLVFPLRIARPELAIDAPTQIIIEKLMIGNYSFDSFKDSVRYAINNLGSQKALGGFTDVSHTNDDAVGLFRGPDGELSNACLPLFINEEHWKRVEIQLKPILGYFFTMDPLGYKGDQMIALYMVLGHMLCKQSLGEFCSEAGKWIVSDFTQTCTHVLPLVMKYVGEGRYSGRVRGDLLEEFVEAPINRTKESMNSLLVMLGWNECTKLRDRDTERFDFAFVEEVWRRAFTAMFKGQPRNQIDEWLESLLFLTSDNIEVSGGDDTLSGNSMKAENKLFSEWGKAKLGLLSKKKTDELLKKYPNGPPSAGCGEGTTYTPRTLVDYESNQEAIDALVEKILANISSRNNFLSKVLDGRVTGTGFSGKAKWLMLVQALKYSSNSAMNQACANGKYKNTFDYCGTTSSDHTTTKFLNDIYEQFETNRKNDWNAVLSKKEDFIHAKKIALTPDLQSYAGRIISLCPTRGGGIFANLVSILSSGKVNEKSIPLLYEKLKAVMTGKIQFVVGADSFVIMSSGHSWVQCSTNTAMLLREVVSAEEWGQIESSMYGVSGWAYRPSDIPNRHGHCVSNPNRALVQSFSGFHLGSAPLSQ